VWRGGGAGGGGGGRHVRHPPAAAAPVRRHHLHIRHRRPQARSERDNTTIIFVIIIIIIIIIVIITATAISQNHPDAPPLPSADALSSPSGPRPNSVYLEENCTEPFSSLAGHLRVNATHSLFKLFSSEPPTPALLDRLFETWELTAQRYWQAYPRFTPPEVRGSDLTPVPCVCAVLFAFGIRGVKILPMILVKHI
jgi:hypothetical protein